MNALSKLLTRVAKRVLSNNPSNEVMLTTADRVVAWRNADYIGDAEVNEIAAVVQDVEAPTSQSDANEGTEMTEAALDDAENAPEPESPDLSGMTKAELLDYAESEGVEARESWTKTQITEAIEAAEQ